VQQDLGIASSALLARRLGVILLGEAGRQHQARLGCKDRGEAFGITWGRPLPVPRTATSMSRGLPLLEGRFELKAGIRMFEEANVIYRGG
jgi:hypothetical protein